MGDLSWPPRVERVAAFLRAAGAEARIEELSTDARTAEQAADAVGCTLGQIVETVVLVCDGAAVAALVPGGHRAEPRLVAGAVGGRSAAIARPEEVLELSGFRPGAVPPFPLPQIEVVLVDRALLRQAVLWTAAGSSRHLVRLAPAELIRLSRGRVERLVRESA